MFSVHYINNKAVRSVMNIQSVRVVNSLHAGKIKPVIEVRLRGRTPEHQTLDMTADQAEALANQLIRVASELRVKENHHGKN
jgi:hypothetical protein